jgi:hypothetical protein
MLELLSNSMLTFPCSHVAITAPSDFRLMIPLIVPEKFVLAIASRQKSLVLYKSVCLSVQSRFLQSQLRL